MHPTAQVNGSISRCFPIKRGVKQGCVLTLTLFAIFFTALLIRAFSKPSGVLLHCRTSGKLFDLSRFRGKSKVRRLFIRKLLYADDAAFVLKLRSLPGETAEILSNYQVSVREKNELKEKVVGFCADNCNTNFGGVKRRGQNNVFFRVKEKIERDLTGIGCAAHIVHNCFQHAVDTLPVCVESLVKIYKFFHIYTVRVTKLKIFCEFVEIEYQRILQHGNTRFLSLLPALQRILEMFEGLKSYFNSQEGCPTLIKKCFEEPTQELYLKFVHGQLKYFNETILS